jgi:hypothetical protein
MILKENIFTKFLHKKLIHDGQQLMSIIQVLDNFNRLKSKDAVHKQS